jgi:putative flippase GtrA
MKALLLQIARFGVVGGIAFAIDVGVMNILMIWLNMNGILAGFISFTVSLLVNFLLSIRFVFIVKDGYGIRRQALIFIFTAVVGLIINELILLLASYALPVGYSHDMEILYSNVGKVISMVVVAVWNFMARKRLLER